MKSQIAIFWALIAGILIGFMISELMEQQKEQAKRIQNLRRKLAAENGFEKDAQNMSSDMGKVLNEIGQAYQKRIA